MEKEHFATLSLDAKGPAADGRLVFEGYLCIEGRTQFIRLHSGDTLAFRVGSPHGRADERHK